MSSLAVSASSTDRARARRLTHRHNLDAPSPWARGDRGVLTVCLALAVIGLAVGWLGVSDTVELDSQARWFAVGILALIVGGLGVLSWLLAGLRNVAIARREVLTETDRRYPAPIAAAADVSAGVYGSVAGMRRFHTLDCLMLTGKQLVTADAAGHRAAGLQPCGICLPDGISHE